MATQHINLTYTILTFTFVQLVQYTKQMQIFYSPVTLKSNYSILFEVTP
jgi:hypothetical protein